MNKSEFIQKYGQDAYNTLLKRNREYYHKRKAIDKDWYTQKLSDNKNYSSRTKHASQKKYYSRNKDKLLHDARLNKKSSYCRANEFEQIANYELALADNFIGWDLHHRLEEQGYTYKELIAKDLYYNRPASELIFLTHAEHTALHEKLRNI